MAPRKEFLPAFKDGFRVPLRDPIGLSRWLREQLKALRDNHLSKKELRRPRRGRPPGLNLKLLAETTGISLPIASRLLTPGGPSTKRNRSIWLKTLRRLEQLPGGHQARRFILTPRDQRRLDEFHDVGRGRLSEREIILWESWEASSGGAGLRAFLTRLRKKEFSEREISEWRRWMMRPFLASGDVAIVMRSWDELSRREQARYIRDTTACIEEILARRQPTTMRFLEKAATLDDSDLRRLLADALGFTEPTFDERGAQVLALLGPSKSNTASAMITEGLADQDGGGEDGA